MQVSDFERKLFKEFLLKHSIYRKYAIELNKYWKYHKTYNESYDDFIGTFSRHPIKIVIASFQWSNTDDGVLYWDAVSNEWEKYYRKHTHNNL